VETLLYRISPLSPEITFLVRLDRGTTVFPIPTQEKDLAFPYDTEVSFPVGYCPPVLRGTPRLPSCYSAFRDFSDPDLSLQGSEFCPGLISASPLNRYRRLLALLPKLS